MTRAFDGRRRADVAVSAIRYQPMVDLNIHEKWGAIGAEFDVEKRGFGCQNLGSAEQIREPARPRNWNTQFY